jgi:hypothetical protein
MFKEIPLPLQLVIRQYGAALEFHPSDDLTEREFFIRDDQKVKVIRHDHTSVKAQSSVTFQ